MWSNLINVVFGKRLGYLVIISEWVYIFSYFFIGLKYSIIKKLVKMIYKYVSVVIGVVEGVKFDLV